jgi:hypothetical protein
MATRGNPTCKGVPNDFVTKPKSTNLVKFANLSLALLQGEADLYPQLEPI